VDLDVDMGHFAHSLTRIACTSDISRIRSANPLRKSARRVGAGHADVSSLTAHLTQGFHIFARSSKIVDRSCRAVAQNLNHTGSGGGGEEKRKAARRTWPLVANRLAPKCLPSQTLSKT
jgi:hypothetical protein